MELVSKTRNEDKYLIYENCLRCHAKLTGSQRKFCSSLCSKLFLKAEYRKRNLAKIREYNRQYRSQAPDTYFVKSDKQRLSLLEKMPVCQRCGSIKNLNMCHIKPHWAHGTNQDHNFIVLCQRCHTMFDDALRLFWGGKRSDYY